MEDCLRLRLDSRRVRHRRSVPWKQVIFTTRKPSIDACIAWSVRHVKHVFEHDDDGTIFVSRFFASNDDASSDAERLCCSRSDCGTEEIAFPSQVIPPYHLMQKGGDIIYLVMGFSHAALL